MKNPEHCDCVNRAPTYPAFRDFEHFPECPLNRKLLLAEMPIGDRVVRMFGPEDYWKKSALALLKHANDWELRYLRLNEEFNQFKALVRAMKGSQ